MTLKKWGIGLLAVGVLGGGVYYTMPMIEESGIQKAEKLEMEDFDKLDEVQIEVIDTASFADDNLEKWFEEKKVVKGEHLYDDNSHTYILISAGKSNKKNQIVWFDGVRKANETLVVGYDLRNGEDFGVKNDTEEPLTLLVRTEGKHSKVKGMVVEKEEVKNPESEVVTEENTGEQAKEAKAEETQLDIEAPEPEKDKAE